MGSIFYKQRRSHKANEIPITFLLLEVIENMQDSLEGAEVFTALESALDWAGLTPEGGLTKEPALSLITRIEGISKSVENDKPAKSGGIEKALKGAGKRAFGTEYLKWFTNLPIAEKCLYAADYDVNKARHLYCELDKELSEEIIKAVFDEKFSTLQAHYEAVVFGMGGTFGGGGSSVEEGEVTDHSVTVDSPNYLDAAQAFVSMQNSFRKSS